MIRNSFVVLAGPDGAGKSTVGSGLQAIASEQGAHITTVNFRGRYIDRPRNRRSEDLSLAASEPHATKERSRLMATIKSLVLWMDLVVSGLVWRRMRRRGRAVLVERYAYDLVMDPQRLGITAAPTWLRSILVRLAPRPDVLVVCRAPAKAIYDRKPELTVAEIQSQLDQWGRMDRFLRGVTVIQYETDEHSDVASLFDQVFAQPVQ